MKQGKYYLVAVLSGILLALSYPPFPLYMFAFIGLVPLLILFEIEGLPKRKFLLVYITFSIYHGMSNWWIGSWQKDTDPFLTLGGIAVWLVHPILFFIPFIPYFILKKQAGSQNALWLFPFFWTAFEWLHSLGDLAYPWLNLGYTQIYNYYWVQIADICGVIGLSFIIAFVNILILQIVLKLRANRGSGIIKMIFSESISIRIAAIVIMLFAPIIYGISRTNEFKHSNLLRENRHISAGIVQPNINPWAKWSRSVYEQVVFHQLIQDSLLRKIGKVDLCVWSETAIPFLSPEFNIEHNFSFLQDWVDSSGIPLLTGFSDIYIYNDDEEKPLTARPYFLDTTKMYDAFNSALILNPRNKLQASDNLTEAKSRSQIYHKMKLTPLGESIPYIEIFSFAAKWLEWGVGISSWRRGDIQHYLNLAKGTDSVPFGAIICIESIFPDFVKNFVRQGAEFLVIITNDAWYNYTPGPEQHYLIAAMRAIETRRYIVRCANSGVSGIISATGKTVNRVPECTTIGFAGTLPLLKNETFYVEYGETASILSLYISILSVTYSLFRRK